MSAYVLTVAAEQDLAQIVDFIANRHYESNALKVFDRIHAAARELSEFPGMGHQRSDIADETLRVWPVHSFLIVYRQRTDPLEIVRILHGGQQVGAILSKNPPEK